MTGFLCSDIITSKNRISALVLEKTGISGMHT